MIKAAIWQYVLENKTFPTTRTTTASGLGQNWRTLDECLKSGKHQLPTTKTLAALSAEVKVEKAQELASLLARV